MADTVGVTLAGVDIVVGKFNEIADDIKRKGGRSSLRKAAQLIRNKAKENAQAIDDPQTPENIAENIVERWSGRRFRNTGDLMFRVGVLGGAKAPAIAVGEIRGQGKNNPGGDTFHWRFKEFGTQFMPADPFLRRALSDNIQAATNEFVSQYDKALDRAIRRAKKAQGV